MLFVNFLWLQKNVVIRRTNFYKKCIIYFPDLSWCSPIGKICGKDVKVMEIWEYEFMEELLENRQRKEELIKELAQLPEGSLVKRKRENRKNEFYVYTQVEGKKKEVYISQKDVCLVKKLKEAEIKRNTIKKELSFLDNYYKRVYTLAQKIKNNYVQVQKEYTAKGSQKEDTYGNLKFKTVRGEMVRSKSERFIADSLFRFNIDYGYEQKLALKGYFFHPDFTIVNPLNGRVCYWEHLGMDDSEYIVDWINRKAIYKDNGIIEGRNLMVTTEKDTNKIDEIISDVFTIRRYDSLFP